MPIITLTSDWGLKDYYVAAVKGRILTYLPSATIIDISHDLPAFDIIRAAFIIKNSYSNFPEGSIHVISVDEEASVETPHIAAYYKGHYFIGSDNGMFSIMFDDKPEKVVELDIPQDSDYYTFPARDVFVKAACHLANGMNIDELGDVTEIKNKKILLNPIIGDDIVKGSVIYIDSYENLITNISEKLFRTKFKSNKFTIVLPPDNRIHSISKSFKDVPKGDLVAFFNTLGLLEIGINNGKASSLLGLHLDSIIRIEVE